MNNKLKITLSALFESIKSTDLPRLQQLLSNPQDNQQLLKATHEKTGNTLLLAAVEKRSLAAVSLLIDHGAPVNLPHATNNNYPINLAWSNGEYGIILKLLQAGSLFPKPFNLRNINAQNQHFSEIMDIINGRNALHQAIQQGNLPTVKSIIQQAVPSKYHFNLDNESVLASAAKTFQPEIYAYLLSIGTEFKNSEEGNAALNPLAAVQKEQLWTALLPYFKASDKSHILYLLSKSKSHSWDINFQERCKQYYEKLDSIPELSLIMQVMQYADHCNIIFDPYNDSIDTIDPSGASGDGTTRGTTNSLDGTIYIAAGVEESIILENLAHEFTHQALLILYANRSNPYFSDINLSKKDLETLLSKIMIPRNKEALILRIRGFLENYPAELHSAEIFPFLSELLVNQFNTSSDPLIKKLKDDHYGKYLTDACKKLIETGYLTKPRNNIIGIEKYAGEGHIIESSLIKLSKDKIKTDILQSVSTQLNNNKKIALITTNNLKLSSHKLYQELHTSADYSLPGRYLFLKFTRFKKLARKVHEVFASKMDPLLIVLDPQGKEIAQPLEELSETLSAPFKKIILLVNPQEVNPIKQVLANFKLQDSYIEIIDEAYTWDHLTPASQEKLLRKYCLFQGSELPLYQLLEKELLQTPLAVSSATVSKQKKLLDPQRIAALQTLITPEVLLELVSEQRLTIGTPFAPNQDPESLFYEPRTLQRSIVINPLRLLENPLQQSNLEGPLFVISGEPETALLPPESAYPFTRAMQELPLTPRYFFISLENSAQWSQLCQHYSTRALHWLRKSKGKLVWQCSSQGSLASLQPYIDHSNPVNYDEGLFTEGKITQKLFILADEPSLGKTSFLHNLAPNLKAAYDQSWVLSLTLNDYSEQFKRYQEGPGGGNYNSQQAIDFLSDTLLQLTSPLEKAIFKHRLQSSTGVSLLLDGLDDLSPEYKKTAINFLKSLKNSQLDTLWITTRTHLKQELETQFNEMAYTLKPLSKTAAITLLSRIWRRTLSVPHNEEKILIYASYLLMHFDKLFHNSSLEFIGNPFFIQFLSTAYISKLQKFIESPDWLPTSDIQSSLTTLYQQLIEKKLAIYFDDNLKFYSSDIGIRELRASQTTSLQQAHQQQALRLLFPEISALVPAPSFTDEALARVGLLKLTAEGLRFIHPTIAEYYAADYFATQLATAHPPATVIDQLLTQLLSAPRHQIVRHFLNDRFIQKPPTPLPKRGMKGGYSKLVRGKIPCTWRRQRAIQLLPITYGQASISPLTMNW